MSDNQIKVLISCRSFGKNYSDGINLMKKAGITPLINTTGNKLTEDEIITQISDVVGIIAGTEQISRKIIESADSLKVISRYGVGIDNIDLKAAKEKNVLVFNTPEATTDAVAELSITLILNLLRKVCNVDKEIRNDKWKPVLGNLLSEKTVGVLGLGKIGKRVVQLLEPFNVKVKAYELHPDNSFIKKYNIETTSLNNVLKNSDIITIHLPLTNETHHIIGEKELSLIKKTAIIINTSRGEIIEEKPLYSALKNGLIAGAALDVFEKEPYSGKLKELDNIILTPHIGSATIETRKEMDIASVNNLIEGLREVGIL